MPCPFQWGGAEGLETKGSMAIGLAGDHRLPSLKMFQGSHRRPPMTPLTGMGGGSMAYYITTQPDFLPCCFRDLKNGALSCIGGVISISLDANEFYNLRKYENFCMDDCGNKD